MKRVILRISLALVILLIVAVVMIAFSLNKLVRRVVQTEGPQITKTPVTLASVRLSPLSGKGEIQGLVIGNPEGYKTESAIKIGAAGITLAPTSLWADKVLIRTVTIDAPEITVEGSLTGNNLSRLLQNIEASSSAAPDQKAKRYEIDDLLITNGKVHLSLTLAGSQTVNLALPEIHLTDLGKDSTGLTGAELAQKVLRAMVDGAMKVAATGVGDIGKTVTNAAGEVGKGAAETVDKATRGLKDLLKPK